MHKKDHILTVCCLADSKLTCQDGRPKEPRGMEGSGHAGPLREDPEAQGQDRWSPKLPQVCSLHTSTRTDQSLHFSRVVPFKTRTKMALWL